MAAIILMQNLSVISHLCPVAFFAAIVCAMALTWSVRNMALARGWAKPPISERHIHTRAIPRFGGVAIYTSFLLISTFVLALAEMSGIAVTAGLGKLAFLLLPATLVFLIGLYDDVVDSKPWTKIVAQIAAGALLYAGGYRVMLTGGLISHEFGWAVSLPLTVFWTLLITNAFNLIDGLDGLAAGSALFSTLAMFVVSLATQNWVVALLTAVLAGVTIGFLRYNFNPATIFLGDSGSLFLGFMLAALSLAGGRQQKSSTLIAVAIPIVAFGLPIVETAISIIRRFLSGQPIFAADREHIHHRLMARGLSHRAAVSLLYAISAGFAVLSLVLLSPGAAPIAVVLTILGAGITFGVQRLRYHEFFEIGRLARRTLDQKHVIINNLLIRRASERVYSCATFDDLRRVLDSTFETNDFDQLTLRLSGADTRDEFIHEWRRVNGDAMPAWKLSLPIVSSELAVRGELTLARFSRSTLLLDINLLTGELCPALADAAHRLTKPHFVPQPVVARAHSAAIGR